MSGRKQASSAYETESNMSTMDKVEWLSWRGYSERKRVSLAGWTEGFAFPSRLYERIPYCIESFDALRDIDVDNRIAMQAELFERTDHSVMATLFMGLIRPDEARWLKDQLTLCLHTMVRLLQLTAADDIEGEELKKVFDALSPAKAKHLSSVLSSSLYFYANGRMRRPFATVLQQPLYLELGIDILSQGLDSTLSEFQVRYASPYPHLLQGMSQCYSKMFPQIFERFGLRQETFSARRKNLLNNCIDRFSAAATEPAARILIDAWAYLKNSGANLQATAKEFAMDYLLFDDLSRAQNVYQKAYRNKPLAIYNFAPLNLLDPSDELFDLVNAERLENYDELGWGGLLERYLNGEIFLANPPMSDLLNDKALYGLIPELCKIFFAESVDLMIGEVKACWSEDDFLKPNQPVLSWALSNKDKAVIAHRYLEGGLGIRVGPSTSSDEWESFIETFVMDRPYLYIIRDYFPMDPDFSLRSLAAMSINHLLSDMSEAQTELSDTFYARLSTESPITTENHRSFLVFPTADEAPHPRYEIEEENVR